MKILSIHFKNINSLEGENSINFTQPPISDTGVFAITGANGSGKTSILDAITLGLYGETFRFDRPANFVMTKHTADCFAEVQFQLDGRQYLSSWRVQRIDADPQGDIQPPDMQLLRLDDGTLLAKGPQQVCDQVAELTGMDFRNFTRSILLAQGDFAAFLNALDSERMAILEKIVGTDIYAAFRKEITHRNEQAQKGLAELKQELAAIELLEPGQREAFGQDLADFTEQYQELAGQKSALEQHYGAAQAIADLRRQASETEGQVLDTASHLEAVQAQLQQILASQDVLVLGEDLTAIAGQEQEITDNQRSLAALSTELDGMQKLLAGRPAPADVSGKSFAEQQATISELSGKLTLSRSNQQSEIVLKQSLIRQATEKQAAADKVSVWLDGHAADEALLTDFPETGRLKKLRAELAELASKHRQLAKKDKKSSALIKSSQSALAQAQKKQLDLERQLAAEQQELVDLTQGKPLEQWVDLRKEQHERAQGFQQLYDMASAYQQLTKTSFDWFGLAKEQPQTDNLEELEHELSQVTDELKREENIQRTLEQSRVFERLVKKLAPDRHHLVDGKPCPLCGALQHPYSHQPPVFADPIKAVADQQMRIRNLQASALRLRKQLAFNQKAKEKNRAVTQRCQQLQSEWLGLSHRLNAASDLAIKDLSVMKLLLASEQQELKEVSFILEQCRDKQTNISKLQNQIKQNSQLCEQLASRAEQISASLSGEAKEFQELTQALASCQQEEQALTEKTIAQLVALGESLPEKGKEDALFDKLNERRQDYHGYSFRKKSLLEELAGLKRKQAECDEAINRHQELIELYSEQLAGAETIGLHLAVTEKQLLLADKQQRLSQQQKQLEASRQAFQERLAASRYPSLDAIKKLLDLHAKQPGLEAEEAQVRQWLADKQAQLAAITGELEEQERLHGDLPPVDELYQQLKSIREKMDIAKLESQRLQKILKEQDILQERYAEAKDRLRQQQAIADACAAETALLNADQGMALRRQAQNRLAERLLSQTNLLLEKLSGRYYLRQNPDSPGLSLEIEDTLQGNVRRFPKTLSGGETFVVSLALALGLSELANNGKAVDSLFLDEGFGNLDAESLFTVISTLETLKTHGKTVGVISHVEAVQKRFKAQLQVIKKANGMGELRKVS